MEYDFDNWRPLTVAATAELMRDLTVPWWIAGGRAIDLFVGRETRSHGDTDVLICRKDQLAVQEYLSSWDLHRATYPGLAEWRRGEYLEGRFNDIWCRRKPDMPWSLQLMLLDTDNGCWVFKRDRSIRGPLREIGRTTSSGVPFLAPAIQLLYKAKTETLEKDQEDFEITAPLLARGERTWLLGCLEKRFAGEHPWVEALREGTART